MHVCAARDTIFELQGQVLDSGICGFSTLSVAASIQEDHFCNVWTELRKAK